MSVKFNEKYINPFTDFGFKKLFGEEPNKDLLLDFLNELLREEQGEIKSLTYIKNEQPGKTESDKKVIFDLACVNEKGETFIVEMQKTMQKFFKDRSLYYSTFPIARQGESKWDYNLKRVYTIAILDFIFDDDKEDPDRYLYKINIADLKKCRIFNDKLVFIYLEMPKFNKTFDELSNRFETWLYLLKNLPKLDEIPLKLKDKIFTKFFETAEIAKFTQEQYMAYEESVKINRDLTNSLNTAIEEVRFKERRDMALSMLKEGLSLSQVEKITGLDAETLKV